MYISGQSIDNFLVNQLVKELLKSDSNCFAKMKKGPVFLTHSVYAVHKLYTEFTTNVYLRAKGSYVRFSKLSGNRV